MCYSCKQGYVEKNNSCYPFEMSNCSLSSIIPLNSTPYALEEEYQYNDIVNNFYNCLNLFYTYHGSKYVRIQYYYETTEEVKFQNECNIHFFNIEILINGKKEEKEALKNNRQVINIISKAYLRLDNLGTGDEFSPVNLRKCKVANYILSNNTYECTKCSNGYSLDEETKTCKQSIKISMNLRPGLSNC